jgi:hypothetical protein
MATKKKSSKKGLASTGKKAKTKVAKKAAIHKKSAKRKGDKIAD